MLALSHPDPALAFPVGTVLQPQIFVRNTLAKPADVTLRFNWRSGTTSGKAAGPSLHLAPYETRRIDVAALQAANVLPPDATWASVVLSTSGLPDEVMAIATSYDQTLRYGAQTPFSDQLTFLWTGSLWEYDAQHNSLITAGNGGTKPLQAAFTIYYNQGTQKYELEQTLQPDEQMWIDVGKLIREHVPDKNGSVLPGNLASGSYEFRDLTNQGIGQLFEGKVVYDKTYGQVTYGCAGCCGYVNAIVLVDPLGMLIDSNTTNGVGGLNSCSDLYDDVSDSFYGNWSTVDPSIATVDYYGIHTGVAVGSTTSKTSGCLTGNAVPRCPNKCFKPGGTDDVVSIKVRLGGPGGTDITNTTQSVVVGQQIVLYGDYTLPSGSSVNSQTWATPLTIVAGYTPTTSSGSLNTNVVLNQRTTTFFWVFATSSATTVTFTLNYGNNLTAIAQASFNVAAPSPVTPTVTLPTNGKLFIDTFTGCSSGGPTQPYLVFGNVSGPVPGCAGTYTGSAGIAFSPPATATPPGQFFFVQLVTADNINYPNLTCTATPGLDGSYPYQSKYGQPVSDAPFAPLPYSSITRSFGATMYLMWQSSTPSSIPIPMGSVAWSFSSSSTLSNGTWSAPTNGGVAGPFTVPYTTSGFPVWSNLAVPANNNCH